MSLFVKAHRGQNGETNGMSENKRKSKKLIILLVASVVTVGLLLFSLIWYVVTRGEISIRGVVRADTFYIMLALLALVPLLLGVLLALLLITRLSKRKRERNIEADTPIVVNVGANAEESETEERGERFCMLCEIDRRRTGYGHKSYDKSLTLKTLCEEFRSFAASELKLYYDIEDIRRFIAGMAVSKLLILQGMSGTGKTSLAHAYGMYIDNVSTVIPVQPMWKERTDLIGYYNEFTRRFNETLLLEKMYEANYSRDMYVTVLDEMNIARVEYYFAEFLSLLELPNAEQRYLEVVSDKWESDPQSLVEGRIKLPDNMWFIGTANNDDSTFAISDKVYDRAMILNLDYKSERFAAPKTAPRAVSAEQFSELVSVALKEYEISRRNVKRLEALDKYLIEHFHITFGNRIMKQIKQYIPVYVSCGGEELSALDDILSKKIMRKLETQNPIYLRNSAEGLLAYIDELFGTDKMPLCKEYIRRLQRNA